VCLTFALWSPVSWKILLQSVVNDTIPSTPVLLLPPLQFLAFLPILRPHEIRKRLWFLVFVVAVGVCVGAISSVLSLFPLQQYRRRSRNKHLPCPWCAWGSSGGPTYSIFSTLPHSGQRSTGRSRDIWHTQRALVSIW